MKHIASAFVRAKRAFGPVLKDKTNPAFKSKYADLAACIEAVDKACLDEGIACYQDTFEDLTGVTVETVFLHESGESLRCGKLHVPASKQDPQGFGSALSYCRRYSLLTACGLAPEDDDGQSAVKAKQAKDAADAAQARTEWLDYRTLELESCETLLELRQVFKEAVKFAQAQKDAEAVALLTMAKDAAKSLIEQGATA